LTIRKGDEELNDRQSTFVHVWSIQWDGKAERQIQAWFDWLSEKERTQAIQLVKESDRQRYILSHGFCRLILSRYLNQEPKAIQFGEEKNHKPIVQTASTSPIHFNLSHASNVAVVAVSDRPVGIDVEWMNPVLVTKEMVDQFMSEEEKSIFFRLPLSQRKKAFYHCWTRKEAYLKALGEGLVYPIQQITVSLKGEKNLTWKDEFQPNEPKRWNMNSIGTISDYVGAVVHQGRKLICYPIQRI
jgi:4'-phosphopantetheinyl transferase